MLNKIVCEQMGEAPKSPNQNISMSKGHETLSSLKTLASQDVSKSGSCFRSGWKLTRRRQIPR